MFNTQFTDVNTFRNYKRLVHSKMNYLVSVPLLVLCLYLSRHVSDKVISAKICAKIVCNIVNLVYTTWYLYKGVSKMLNIGLIFTKLSFPKSRKGVLSCCVIK